MIHRCIIVGGYIIGGSYARLFLLSSLRVLFHLVVTGDIRVAMTVLTGIRVTKAIAKCVLSNSNCRRQEYVKY
ncbi:MAG: hypothetical protein JO327_14290 [Nitrososphaeraceae archaeon]|nr:hypothetical protein [Nitrososphaeraceae archaeon]MBV9669282.1 hypothetical protein [Nitrososphaeraceae archaeon]